MKPMEIEKRSFEIIASELGEKKLDPEYDLLIRRVIHTTADFDYADNLAFSDRAMGALTDALRSGCPVVTDTTMAMAGINKKTLARFGGEVHCFIGDADVAEQAKARGVTRSLVSMEKAADTLPDAVFAIGNAPTALFSICDLVRAGLPYIATHPEEARRMGEKGRQIAEQTFNDKRCAGEIAEVIKSATHK